MRRGETFCEKHGTQFSEDTSRETGEKLEMTKERKARPGDATGEESDFCVCII